MEKKPFIKKIKVLKKRVKLSTLFMLFLTFSINTFAWFVYSTKVDSAVQAHVRSWNVEFTAGEEEIEQEYSFDVPEVYPGMQNFLDSVTITNKGESTANITFEIVSMNILGTVITADGTTITSNDLLSSLAEDYPFAITISSSSNRILPGTTESFSISVIWPYESGDDAADTHWGNLAYDYKLANAALPSIEINLKISAVQG